MQQVKGTPQRALGRAGWKHGLSLPRTPFPDDLLPLPLEIADLIVPELEDEWDFLPSTLSGADDQRLVDSGGARQEHEYAEQGTPCVELGVEKAVPQR